MPNCAASVPRLEAWMRIPGAPAGGKDHICQRTDETPFDPDHSRPVWPSDSRANRAAANRLEDSLLKACQESGCFKLKDRSSQTGQKTQGPHQSPHKGNPRMSDERANLSGMNNWDAGIRTPTGRARVCSPTIRRRPITLQAFVKNRNRGAKRFARAPGAVS